MIMVCLLMLAALAQPGELDILVKQDGADKYIAYGRTKLCLYVGTGKTDAEARAAMTKTYPDKPQKCVEGPFDKGKKG